MKFEECSKSLLSNLANVIGDGKDGYFIEIGAGTFDYYFIDFVNKGYKSLVVEPIPCENLLNICEKNNVNIEKSCISDKEGFTTMYIGKFDGKNNTNLSSLNKDWWGSGTDTIDIPSLKLESLIKKWNITKIAVLKLDTEGSEYTIIKSFNNIPKVSLPYVIQFEYGGGGKKMDKKGGWESKYFKNTCSIINLLKSLNYKILIIIDRDLPNIKILYLPEINDFEKIFNDYSQVGNAIVCMDEEIIGKINIDNIIKSFIDYPPDLMEKNTHIGLESSTQSYKFILPYVISYKYLNKKKSLNILEYGPGCNTQQFLDSLVSNQLVSIEDNLEWYNKYNKIIEQYKDTYQDVEIDYKLINVESIEGKNYHGGHCWTEKEILDYTYYPQKYGNKHFDIIFIDAGDRQDDIIINNKKYYGWPIRNICLEVGHSLLNDDGIVVLHDVPSPHKKMNESLKNNIYNYKYYHEFYEFHTTILSDTLNLSELCEKIEDRYRLNEFTKFITDVFNKNNNSWLNNRLISNLIKKYVMYYDSASPNTEFYS